MYIVYDVGFLLHSVNVRLLLEGYCALHKER